MNRRPGIWGSAATLLVMAGLSLWAAPRLGEQVPMHWNLSGEVDRYGSRLEGLIGIPLITLAVSLLLAFLPRLEPRRRHLQQSARAYNAVWITTLAVLTGVHAAVLFTGVGYAVPVGTIAPALVAVLLLVMGNYFGKVRSNFFFGIRTPWTLTSERSWDRTHRLAGRLLAGLGALVLLSMPFGSQVAGVLLLAGVLLVVLVTSVYSYLVWRDDVGRTPGSPGRLSS